jgi:GDP-L-fucose synthase
VTRNSAGKVFVTGGAGFLGRTVVPRFREAGYLVDAPVSAECDLTQQESLRKWNKPYDLILHLAAWTQAGDFCLRHPGEQWIVNQKINTNVLSWWQKQQPQAKTVLIGTSCAYDPRLSLTEENYLCGQPIESLYVYAMTKRMLEIGARALQRQFDLTHMTLVPGTLCGPYYHKDGRQMHFIYDLARKVIEAASSGNPAVLWGDGYQRREVLAVDDFVGALLALVSHDAAWGNVINVASGVDYTIREFADVLRRHVGLGDGMIEFDTSKYVGARAKRLDVSKLEEIMEWRPLNMEQCVCQVLRAFAV